MKLALLIGTGGFLGTIARYLLSKWAHLKIVTDYPVGTLSVNVLGCLIIGIIYALADKAGISTETRFFLATGFCGGFTTFSSFSYDTLVLIREGQFWYAFTYITISVIAGFLAVALGYFMSKSLF